MDSCFSSKVIFTKGKELWSNIDGRDPTPNDMEQLAKWKIEDALVMS